MSDDWGEATLTGEWPSFGAGKAFAAFVILFIVQFGVGFVMGMRGAIIAAGASGPIKNPQEMMRIVMEQTMVPFLLVSSLISAMVIWVIARKWAWHLVVDRTEFGLGIRPLPAGQIAPWFSVGLVLGAGYVAFATSVVKFDSSSPLGPLATLAAAGGTGRLVWAGLAILYAPIFEEFFFRGLLFTGFSNSSGETQAGALVTILFIAVHLPETWVYWPATLAVSLLAAATLAARVVTGSLLASLAVHLAYNVVIVVGTYLFPADI